MLSVNVGLVAKLFSNLKWILLLYISVADQAAFRLRPRSGSYTDYRLRTYHDRSKTPGSFFKKYGTYLHNEFDHF